MRPRSAANGRGLLNRNSLDLVERDVIAGAVVELSRARASCAAPSTEHFPGAALIAPGSEPRRRWRRHSRREEAPLFRSATGKTGRLTGKAMRERVLNEIVRPNLIPGQGISIAAQAR